MQGASVNNRVVRVVSDPKELPGLEAMCASLYRASADPSAALAFPYFSRAWDIVARGRLHIVVIGEDVVWPLYVSGGIVRQLGSGGSEEYGGALGQVDQAAASLALETALSGGNVLEVYNLRPDHPLAHAIERHGRFYRGVVNSPIITVGGDANAWRKGKSKSFRQTINNARNRLAKAGQVEVDRVDPANADRFTHWLFETKCRWLDANGIGESWIRRAESERFFAALLSDPDSDVIGFAITLDGNYVAGSTLLLSKDIEFFTLATDPAFAAYSPGQLLMDALVDLAASTGTRIDMRITQDAYKMRWADEKTEPRVSYVIAANWRGWPRVLKMKVGAQIKAARRRLGALRRRVRSGQ